MAGDTEADGPIAHHVGAAVLSGEVPHRPRRRRRNYSGDMRQGTREQSLSGTTDTTAERSEGEMGGVATEGVVATRQGGEVNRGEAHHRGEGHRRRRHRANVRGDDSALKEKVIACA